MFAGATTLAPQDSHPMPPMAEQPLQPEYDVTVGHGGGYGYGFAGEQKLPFKATSKQAADSLNQLRTS